MLKVELAFCNSSVSVEAPVRRRLMVCRVNVKENLLDINAGIYLESDASVHKGPPTQI